VLHLQVIGKNCRFLQGKGTERRKVRVPEAAEALFTAAAAKAAEAAQQLMHGTRHQLCGTRQNLH
jgi:hypothetical protein